MKNIPVKISENIYKIDNLLCLINDDFSDIIIYSKCHHEYLGKNLNNYQIKEIKNMIVNYLESEIKSLEEQFEKL